MEKQWPVLMTRAAAVWTVSLIMASPPAWRLSLGAWVVSAAVLTPANVSASDAFWAIGAVESATGGLEGGLLKGEGADPSWSVAGRVSLEQVHAVAFIDEARGWVVGRATILHTNDAGISWREQWRTDGADLVDVAFAPEGEHGVIVGSKSMRSTDVEEFSDGSAGAITREDPLILQTSNGGAQWEPARILPPEKSSALRVVSACLTSGGHGLVVGDDGGDRAAVFVSRDHGQTWLRSSGRIPARRLERAVCAEASDLWLIGSGRDLLRSRDGGASWTDLSGPIAAVVTGQLSDVAFVDPSNAWLVGLAIWKDHPGWSIPVAARTVDGGASWRAEALGEAESMNGGLSTIAFARDARRGIAAGQRRADDARGALPIVLVNTDGGRMWRVAALPPFVRTIVDVAVAARARP